MRTRVPASALAALALILGLALGTAPAGAVPAKPGASKELAQPDGTTVRGHLYGDEWKNGLETRNGYTLARDRDSGYWEYAAKDSRGRLVASGRRPGRDAPKAAPHLRDDTAEPLPDPAPAMNGTIPGSAEPVNIGTQRALVILVRFADQASLGTTAANWNARFFGTSESVSDYFKEVSFNNLTIAPAAETCGTDNDGVAGWFTLTRNHPNVTKLDNTTIGAAQETVRDAIVAANGCVNYASYDTDSDGKVESDELHITVIPAGWEASSGCATPSVWGHKYGAYAYTPTVDGVQAGTSYTMFGEKHCDGGTTNPRMAQLGIMVHEIGHDLGWPDLYDVDYSTKGNVGYWSVMASGSWLARPTELPGASPPHPDAFSKAYQGWITPTFTSGSGISVSLPPAATNPVARQLRTNPDGIDWSMNVTAGTGEYFLVENRQKVGYDRALPGCGIAIWHISEVENRFTPNQYEPRRLVALEEADGETDDPYDAGDVWTGAKAFGNLTTPNSKLYDATTSGVAASAFSGCGATMTAKLTGPADTTPPPPAGDMFASPHTVTSGTFTKTGISTATATTQAGESTSCTVTGTSTTSSYGKTLWFKYTPGTSGNATVDTTGTTYDTVMAGYEGTTLGGLVGRACNDDTTAGGEAKFTLPVTAGKTYYFQVGGYLNNGTPESGTLAFKLTGPAPGTVTPGPANDAFASARAATTLPFAPATFSTAAATTQTSEKTWCTPPGATTGVYYGKTVWFKYVPNVDMTIDATTGGSNFNTVMTLYSGTTLAGLTRRVCNNDATTSTTTSRLRVNLTAGTTYYLQVGGFKATSGGTPASGTLKFSLTGIPRANAFGRAQAITLLPYAQSRIDTTKMTTEAGEPTSCTPRGGTATPLGKTIWFTYRPTVDGTVTATTANSTYDTVMGVYRGTTLGGLTAVNCNDDIDNANDILTSRVRFNVVAGQRYYFQVGGYRDTADGSIEAGRLSFRLAAG